MRITEQQLAEIAEKAALAVECLGGSAYEHASNVVELIGEVRRCHTLIREAEWAGGTNEWTNEATCPWCGSDNPTHADYCPAFGSGSEA